MRRKSLVHRVGLGRIALACAAIALLVGALAGSASAMPERTARIMKAKPPAPPAPGTPESIKISRSGTST